MSRARIRFAVGTARLRAAARLRRARGRMRRSPQRTAIVPRPQPLARGSQPLRLTHALLGCDLNPRYLDLWPVARRAWAEIAGLEPVLVLVARPDEVPVSLARDPAVRIFEPLPSLHTAFQAQCIRLLYPALLETDGALITSDVDMVPMNPRYFRAPLARVDRGHFVCYRDVLLPLGELPICYNAARPETWASIFGVRGLDDVRSRLREWADGVEYAGTHGGTGWTTDQRELYRILLDRGRRRRDVWILNDDVTGHRRLERAYVEKWGSVSEHAGRLIERGAYSDFHLLRADSAHARLNERVVDLAVEATRAARQRWLLG